jgi:hypothetical protein
MFYYYVYTKLHLSNYYGSLVITYNHKTEN